MGTNHDPDGVGEPVLRHRKPDVGRAYEIAVPQTSDEFDSDKLGLQWQWHANHDDDWHSLTARPGALRLFSQFVQDADFAKACNLLLQKLPAKRFALDTALTFSPASDDERAGLIIMGLKHAALLVQRSGNGYRLIYRVNNQDREVAPLRGAMVHLGVNVEHDGGCAFRYRLAEGD